MTNFLFKKPENRSYYLWFCAEEQPMKPFFAGNVADARQAISLSRQYGFREEDLYLVEEATSALDAIKRKFRYK